MMTAFMRLPWKQAPFMFLTVRQAKTTGLAYTLGDADELSLDVSAHGGKS
jgi:hypothetical protein